MSVERNDGHLQEVRVDSEQSLNCTVILIILNVGFCCVDQVSTSNSKNSNSKRRASI